MQIFRFNKYAVHTGKLTCVMFQMALCFITTSGFLQHITIHHWEELFSIGLNISDYCILVLTAVNSISCHKTKINAMLHEFFIKTNSLHVEKEYQNMKSWFQH